MGSPAAEASDVQDDYKDVNLESGSLRVTSNDLDEEFLPLNEDDEMNGFKDQIEPVIVENDSTEESRLRDEKPVHSSEDTAEAPSGERRLSLKRSRSSCFDTTPCVQVTYNCLTRESKGKLKELLQQWAQWHSEFVQVEEAQDVSSEPLENGDEIYFPPLQVRGTSNSTVSFWMDKFSKQARMEIATGDSIPGSQDIEKDVPLYDRVASGALISQETEISLEGGLETMDECSRCFNCGSYSHSLKECPRPRDVAAINNARKLLAEKRGSANGSRSASRYYQTSPGGKFDDLKPGVLGSEIRQLLGIGERDPPPWLTRMRELGYPPGYIEDQEEEESGIRIYGTNEDADGNCLGEDGEIVGEKKNKHSTPEKKMKVHFPGVNAPIPDDADRNVWSSPSGISSHDHHSRKAVNRGAHYNAPVADGSEEWEGPPGSSGDKFGKNSKTRSTGFEGPLSNRTPPWLPSEHGKPGLAPLPRSPHLSRSASDTGKSSRVAYDEPHPFPPFNHRSASRHRPYQSPPPLHQSFHQRTDSREEDSRRRAWAHAHDALHRVHHNDRYSPHRR